MQDCDQHIVGLYLKNCTWTYVNMNFFCGGGGLGDSLMKFIQAFYIHSACMLLGSGTQ